MIRIAHLADVHYRGLARHDEYRQVFDAFAEDALAASVDRVYVAGDIFHTKTTGISPEYIQEISRWMTQLSSVAETHLILGNHDGNLINLSRQDAVTPIFDLVKQHGTKNPIRLWKWSGVYDFAPGMKLCLFSIFDKETWDKVKPVPGYVNIATYHGPVSGARTESDWVVEGDVSLEMFKEYDFVFLGDIHRLQYLCYRMIKGEERPWIAYPGSVLQQNYAEAIDHGYLLWEIEDARDFDVSFRKLPNPRPFITVNWRGNVESTVEQARGFGDGVRVRVRSDRHIAQGDSDALSTALRSEAGASEITFKSDVVVGNPVFKGEDNQTLVRDDFRNADVVLGLVRSFHSSTSFNDDDIDRMRSLINGYIHTITNGDDVTRHTTWSLREFRFDNLYGYGEGNVINFDKLNGITGIFGPNRTGKSSIPGGIMYTLFNTSDRGMIKNIDICNVRKPYCYGKVRFSVDGVDYIVERQTSKHETKKKGVFNSITALNIWKVEQDGSLNDQVCDSRNNTEKALRKILGTAEDYLLTGLSSQGETDSFVKYRSTARWRVLARFLDIDIFARMEHLVKEDIKGFKAQLRNFPERNWGELARDARRRLEECTESIEGKVDELQKVNARLADVNALLTAHGSKVVVTPVQVEQLRMKLESDEAQLLDNKEELKTLRSENKANEKKLSKIDDLLAQHDITALRAKVDEIGTARTRVSDLKHALERHDSTLASKKRSAKLLETVPCDDKFPTCRFIKDAHEDKAKIAEQERVVQEAHQLLVEAQEMFKSMLEDDIEGRLKKLEALRDRRSKLELAILRKKNEIDRLEHALRATEEKVEQDMSTLQELESALNDEENSEIVQLRTESDNIRERIDEIDNERFALATRKGRIESEITNMLTEKRTRDEILGNMRIHELLAIAFSKKGIPRTIITSQLPVINIEIAKLLSGVTNYKIEFEVEDGTDRLEMYIDYGDSRRIIELGSGMEKLVASIAIRVALINVSSLPRPDVFFIDEGFGALDSLQIETGTRLVRVLKDYFKNVLIISHVDAVKEIVDGLIEITKDEQDSRVVYD